MPNSGIGEHPPRIAGVDVGVGVGVGNPIVSTLSQLERQSNVGRLGVGESDGSAGSVAVCVVVSSRVDKPSVGVLVAGMKAVAVITGGLVGSGSRRLS